MKHDAVRQSCPFWLTALALSLIAFSAAPAVDCPVACNDFNACTIDSCDTTTGTCRFDPLNCDDHNPCTTDSCANFAGFGCLHFSVSDGTACDDGNSCTTGDACSSSKVVGIGFRGCTTAMVRNRGNR